MSDKKVIIVEGTNDKHQVKKVLLEEVDILCTHGTFGVEKFDEMLEEHDLDNRDVYLFVDADEAGGKLRKQLMWELPQAMHLYVPVEWIEVEATPERIIATELLRANFDVDSVYLRW